MVFRSSLRFAAFVLATAPSAALAEQKEPLLDRHEPAAPDSSSENAPPAQGDDASCANGWFCEPGQAAEAAPASPPEVKPAAVEPPPAPSQPAAAPAPRSEPPATRPRVGHAALQKARLGLVGRLGGALLGQGSSSRTPWLTGIGAAFRFRPLPHFALDAALDGFSGRDFLGAKRAELAISVTTQLFFNPQRLYVVYLPAGLFHAWAHVEPLAQSQRNYRYVGAFLGLGVERSLGRNWAMFADLVGFLRGRTDPRAINNPEYVDLHNGEVTNSSGGGLIRVGGALYF